MNADESMSNQKELNVNKDARPILLCCAVN